MGHALQKNTAFSMMQEATADGVEESRVFLSADSWVQRGESLITLLLLLVTWLCWGVAVLLFAVCFFRSTRALASDPDPKSVQQGMVAGSANASGTGAPVIGQLYIREYRVQGAHLLKNVEVEGAVYPFLGPGRSEEDVEHARAALEKACKDRGYQTVVVQIPRQQVRGGVVMLQVQEEAVGQLRVRGSRYFLPSGIKAGAPSLAEGKVINFNDVTRDILSLNQLPDRQITPALKAGMVPGTVDIDLNVKDTFPLHGSIELNNRYSANTTGLRLNGSVSYNNLWQLGHSLGFSFQLAPERLNDAEVFSAYYLARFPGVDWLSLMLQGTKQDSNVSTLGGSTVAGRGETAGFRAMFALPGGADFYQSLSIGIDYKHYDQNLHLSGSNDFAIPITYWPVSATYTATWMGRGQETDLNAGVNLHLRGLGSSESAFDSKRTGSGGNYIYFRGDLSYTRDLPAGFQGFEKLQVQVADQPLIDSEQFSAGGLGTVRGYWESAALGDNAVFFTQELRSPSLGNWVGKSVNEWRVYIFGEGGLAEIYHALPDQESRFYLASVGAGSRIKLIDHFNGSADLGIPLVTQSQNHACKPLLTFRIWGDF